MMLDACASRNTPHVQALIKKHAELEKKIEEEQKRIAASDGYISFLKRKKLRLKEQIEGIVD